MVLQPLLAALNSIATDIVVWGQVTALGCKEARLHAGEPNLPEEVTESMLQSDEDFLRHFHHALLELILEEGALVCPETGRRFPVHKGVPNLLLHEDEV